jgi:hypothetical protein
MGIFWTWIMTVAMWIIGQTPDAYASVPVSVVLTRPSYYTIQQTGQEIPIGSYPKREDVREKVMAWMKNATGIEV